MSSIETIREFITNEIMQRPLKTHICDNDQLVESGIIDSLSIITLLSFLEEEFSIQIQNEDLVPENFASLSAIATLVNR